VNLAVTVIQIVAPVFLLGAIGFGWVRMGFEYHVDFVTRLGINLAVPALVFTALMKSPVDPQALGALTLAAIVAHVAIGLLLAIGLWFAGLSLRTFLAPMTFGNTGNLGLPLASLSFGQAGLGYGVVILAVTSILSFSIGVWVVAGGGSLRKILTQPLVIATILGAVFLSQGWQTPQVLTNALELLGQMAIPLMLITLGVAVARITPAHVMQAVGLSLVKLAVCATVGFGVAQIFALEHAAYGVLVLQMCTPVGVSSYLLAEKFSADGDTVAGLVVVSTLMSVISLPILLAIVL
jgi:predicted permease